MSWMARHPVAANLLMVFLLLGGLFMAFQIKQEVFPEVALDTVMIVVPYPGASPEEVERGVLQALEEEVRGLDGVKRVHCVAQEGRGVVRVALLAGANQDKVLQDVRNAVDRITSFPEEAETPAISMPTSRREVVWLVIYGDLEERVLRRLAARARDELLLRPEVTLAELAGVRRPEISIEVPASELRGYKLTLDRISREIARGDVEMPGGGVKTSSGEVLLRTVERREWGREFEDVVLLSNDDGATVRVGDIATIRDGFEDTDESAVYNGKPAAIVQVFRVGDQTPVEVADAVRAYAEQARDRLPAGVEMALWQDWSVIYKQRMDLLLKNAAIGLVLVLLVLSLFLEVRLAFWVTMGIPVAFLGAMLLLPAMDVSINMISLFAFIMALGIVVDDAIMVGENIHEMRQGGMPFLRAAAVGARQVAVPVVFSVLTNIAAFMPLFFVPGVMGKLFWTIPAIVVSVFAISLVECLFVLPAHLAHPCAEGGVGLLSVVVRIARGVTYWPRRLCTWALEGFVCRVYGPVLSLALRVRYLTIAAGVAALAVVVGLVGGGYIGFRFMPRIEHDVVTASAVLPYGSPAVEAEGMQARLMGACMATLDGLHGRELEWGMLGQIGVPAASLATADESAVVLKGGHLVNVSILLGHPYNRDFTAGEFTRRWRERAGEVAGVESLTFKCSVGPSGGAPIDIELSHPDVATLERAAASLAGALAGYRGVKDIDDGFQRGKPQVSFRVRPEARSLNVTALDLGRQVRAAFYGAEAVRRQRGRDEVKVMVRLPESERASMYDVESMVVRTPDGGEVPLREAAEVVRDRAHTVIQRTDGRRVMHVTADVDESVVGAEEVLAALREGIRPGLTAEFPGLGWTSAGEHRELVEGLTALSKGFFLAAIVIFALLAIPLRSYVQPAIVMTAVPFGVAGAVLGHMVMGYDLSLISMMGMVALSGVVVNDSLVFLYATNERRRDGAPAAEAVWCAGRRRFRPIFLTSLTTFVGLAPMIFEQSAQARYLIPMAISLGYGILFATGITLVLVPALYLVLDDLRRLGSVSCSRPVAPRTRPAFAGR